MGNNTKSKIINEAKRIEEDCLFSAKGHFYAAQFWTNLHFRIGVPMAIFAAISGASALSQFENHTIVAGVLAILVASLAAVSTFLNPNERASSHHNAGNEYNSLRNQARIFSEINTNLETDENRILDGLKTLAKLRDELNQKSPQIPRWAYKKAKRGIEEGEADYRFDE